MKKKTCTWIYLPLRKCHIHLPLWQQEFFNFYYHDLHHVKRCNSQRTFFWFCVLTVLPPPPPPPPTHLLFGKKYIHFKVVMKREDYLLGLQNLHYVPFAEICLWMIFSLSRKLTSVFTACCLVTVLLLWSGLCIELYEWKRQVSTVIGLVTDLICMSNFFNLFPPLDVLCEHCMQVWQTAPCFQAGSIN